VGLRRLPLTSGLIDVEWAEFWDFVVWEKELRGWLAVRWTGFATLECGHKIPFSHVNTADKPARDDIYRCEVCKAEKAVTQMIARST
jgi:hypothetical protein